MTNENISTDKLSHQSPVLIDASLYFLRSADLSGMAQRLLGGAVKLTGADCGLIAAIDAAGQPELLARVPEDSSRPGSRQAQLESFWFLPAQRRHCIIATAETLPDLPNGVAGFIGLPLFRQDNLVGVIGLTRNSGTFAAAVINDLEVFGGMAALAIWNSSAQRAEQQALEELRQAQKMEALGQLAAGIAHDFNNMLTVINGYGAQVKQALTPTDPNLDDMAILLEATSKAAELSRQLLAFSRCQVLSPRPVDLNAIIRSMHRLFKRIGRENIVISLELDPGTDFARADPGQVEQILMNLLVNARDAMPEGGRVAIRSGNAEFDKTFTDQHKGSIPGAYAWFSLADSGEGIAPEDLPRIFQPFFTTKEQGKGTGLGLASVYGAVKQSGGYISVTSQPGEGSCFTVYLPRTDIDTLEAERPMASELPRGGGTLLLVEDDPEVLRLLEKTLSRRGYTVLSANDPEQAMALFAEHQEQIKLLVTDMVMPNLSGPLLAKVLRQKRPGLPVLYISGYGQVTCKSDFTCGETGDFLAKPFSADELLDAVRNCLGSKADQAHN